MHEDLVASLKKNFETNYKRVERLFGLKKFESVFGDDYVVNLKRLMELYQDMERNLSPRAAKAFKGMIAIVVKINDLEHPGWDQRNVKEGIYSCKSQVR